jgi:cystathionine beta-lyase family protein involved in aluminum resistance
MQRFSPTILKLRSKIIADRREQFDAIDAIASDNTLRILDLFRKHRLSETDFRQTTGYGYGDIGRGKLDSVWADLFGAEKAVVRSQIVSGTHALACCLFGSLRPGGELLALTGKPYDTLLTLIGTDKSSGSLTDWGVTYREVPFSDFESAPNVGDFISPLTKLVLIQRSCGYSRRRSLSVEEIETICRTIKSSHPDVVVLVDNCYGEFTERLEPSAVGADLVAGSLIKNPGGGIVPSGGYFTGKADLVEQAAFRLTAPGIGDEVGPSLTGYRTFFQGLFLAPHVTAQSMKTAIFAAALFEELSFDVFPRSHETRHDIIQSIQLDTPERLVSFCRGLQRFSPVDSHIIPEPAPMPGYSDPVVMAGGTFIQGSSIELSADAPLREPYIVFLQGGLTFEHSQIALMGAADQMMNLS